jgi:hypothetical protein
VAWAVMTSSMLGRISRRPSSVSDVLRVIKILACSSVVVLRSQQAVTYRLDDLPTEEQILSSRSAGNFFGMSTSEQCHGIEV